MGWPKGVPRSPDTRAKISQSLRSGSGRAGELSKATDGRFAARKYPDKPCRRCEKLFTPRGSRHATCDTCQPLVRYNYKGVFTTEEYDALLAKQEGRCAICRSANPGGPAANNRFYGDHCHSTGKPRGLLCLSCNIVLGAFKDAPSRFIAAADYLRVWASLHAEEV
jgi:recombination endonuclease VII